MDKSSTISDAIKTVVVGSSNAGKTCLLSRFVYGEFDTVDVRVPAVTVASAFFAKSVLVGTKTVKLHLWDTAGDEAFRSIIPMYYRNARAAILCYDIANYRSFNELQFWVDELVKKEPDCRLYLCGCKLDLQSETRQVSVVKAKQFAETIRATAFIETSARTGENVNALFNRICCDAVEWEFISITTGECSKQQPSPNIVGGAGNKRSFYLSAKESTSNGTTDVNQGQHSSCFHQCKFG